MPVRVGVDMFLFSLHYQRGYFTLWILNIAVMFDIFHIVYIIIISLFYVACNEYILRARRSLLCRFERERSVF